MCLNAGKQPLSYWDGHNGGGEEGHQNGSREAEPHEREAVRGADAQISEQGCFSWLLLCSGKCDLLKQTSPYKRIQEIVLLLFFFCCNEGALATSQKDKEAAWGRDLPWGTKSQELPGS